MLERALSRYLGCCEDVVGLLTSVPYRRFDLKKDTTLVHPGEESRFLYYIRSGSAKAQQVTPSGIRHIQELLVEGDIFGISILFKDKAAQELIGSTDSIIIGLPRRRLEKVIESRPRHLRKLFLAAEHRSRTLTKQSLIYTHGNAVQRISFLLTSIVKRQMQNGVTDPHFISIPLTQYEIADMVALTNHTVSRTISILSEDGLILYKDRRIRILDIARMQSKIKDLVG